MRTTQSNKETNKEGKKQPTETDYTTGKFA